MMPVEPNRTARLEARITPDALAIVRCSPPAPCPED